ncbi:MAG: hypothetical protein K0R86_2145 [Enterobacter kobei]|nr:hypothetical protein [Enterobacter kobei]
MHFINGDRRIEVIGPFTLFALHDFFRQPADHRGSFRTHLRFEGIRVGFDAQIAVGVEQLEFIQLAVMCTGDKQLPDAGFFAQAHWVAAAIPVVELSHHRDATSVWCPDGEFGAGNAIHGVGVRTQRFVRAQMGAFGQQPDIKILNQRAEAIRVIDQVFLTVPDDGKLIAEGIFATLDNAGEKTA